MMKTMFRKFAVGSTIRFLKTAKSTFVPGFSILLEATVDLVIALFATVDLVIALFAWAPNPIS
jgi:hypothetical protein